MNLKRRLEKLEARQRARIEALVKVVRGFFPAMSEAEVVEASSMTAAQLEDKRRVWIREQFGPATEEEINLAGAIVDREFLDDFETWTPEAQLEFVETLDAEIAQQLDAARGRLAGRGT